MKKSKIISLMVAGVLTATALLAGTYAWKSISQKATNKLAEELNPGGRLHDDFNGRNKDVYVENFTDPNNSGVTIYARVKMTEYLEWGTGAGEEDSTDKKATPLITGDIFNDVTTWETYKPNNPEDKFRDCFEWEQGGSTTYMPTFNKNKDSLEADIFGTFNGNVDTDVAKDYTYEGTIVLPSGEAIASKMLVAPSGWYFLRSPRDGDYGVANVYTQGQSGNGGYIDTRGGARPALWINLDK